MLCNLFHNMYDFNVSDLFTLATNNYVIRGHRFKLFIDKYQSRTDLRKHSFSRYVINSWNNFPGELQMQPQLTILSIYLINLIIIL